MYEYGTLRKDLDVAGDVCCSYGAKTDPGSSLIMPSKGSDDIIGLSLSFSSVFSAVQCISVI